MCVGGERNTDYNTKYRQTNMSKITEEEYLDNLL